MRRTTSGRKKSLKEQRKSGAINLREMDPPIHSRKKEIRDFDRLKMLWEKYPQYHERATFAIMEDLLSEHESWNADFEELREEYMGNGYDRFLIQLSWADLAYRYATMERIREAGGLARNPYVEAFMDQFRDLDTDHQACFLFPETYMDIYL
jgi:hypothetical protein